jgi:hypothetical protein
VKLTVSSWTDTRIVARLPSVQSRPPAATLDLTITRGTEQLYRRPTNLEETPMAITAAAPEPLSLLDGTPLKLTGTNFGPSLGGTLMLGDRELTKQSWSDTGSTV